MRIGIGYDIHKLAEGRKMVLGGIEIPFEKGPLGHSDGDVLIHAICDAFLGAMGKGDIGMMFPDSDPSYKDAKSTGFLSSVTDIMKKEGYTLENLDCIVIAEEPKISVYKNEIVKKLGEIVEASEDRVNLKGKTAEKMGNIGKGEAIAAYATVLLKEKT